MTNARCCPGCGSDRLTDLFEATGQPVHVGIFGETAEQARALPTGEITLAHCGRCGLVHNRSFEPAKLGYRPGYEVALHHSATFRDYLDGLIDGLIDRFDLRGKRALEIGCGDGYFLTRLAERAGLHGVGVDPTAPREGRELAGDGTVELIRAYFDEGTARRVNDPPVEFVACLSAFEHVPQPAGLLKTVREMAGGRAGGLYFETFDARRALGRGEIWSVHYEQCNLFGAASLAALFQHAGLTVTDAGNCYAGDQYAYVDAVAGPAPADPPQDLEPDGLPPELAKFRETYRARHAEWTARLAEWRATGKTAAFWGAAGKGVTFLNSLPLAGPGDGVVEAVVDSNPDKHGKFLPGTGHPIVPPEALAANPPDAIVLSNALYEREIRARAEELGVTCEFHVA
ncbi:class I SAM-dependent methyltransferase [Alienimonas californiensis]|uniref:C-methyltransferase domain-containing protein n=1 Tax=Alienimonas californiensis TaxID=2527989 RepID=A0A517PCS5_9PLAN|nr:class I SAM-dependent methyltransferase [Alienimonas californiensis]QDT17175.1 hypothetical protein CA12_32870 [Alienimonas californiensis]